MNHPTSEQLGNLVALALPPEESERVEAHVNACACCQDRLEALQRPRPPEVALLARLLLEPPAEAGRMGGDTDAEASRGEPPPEWPVFAGYELLERLGSGGMGEVYRARHRASRRVVALKTLPPACDPQAPAYRERLRRFRTEAEAVSRLQHANIVSVYDVGEQDTRRYLTMEWVSGGSLADRLAGKPQPQRLAAEWVAALARAMQHVHEQGVLHRDLKPANILLTTETQRHREDKDREQESKNSSLCLCASVVPLTPKITDFGVAKLLDRSGAATPALQWLGTPEYMAPEQAANRPGAPEVGPAADVYALGVILYEMLTGRPPFRADEPLETLRQVRDEEPVPPRRLRPRLARDLETICQKCLEKAPERRYASARALAEDLESWLGNRPIQARPTSTVGRLARWGHRHPERAALAGLVLVLLVSVLAAAGWQWRLAQVDYTRQLAASADHQLLLVKYAVRQTAVDTTLRSLLGAPAGRHEELRRYLEATRRDFARWFTRPGENPPIINWFVMDPRGTILGDSAEEPRSVGRNYAFRDYFTGLMGGESPADPAAVHVSRVYRSEQDGRYKFTVITRVWESERLLGLVGASLAVDSRLVALDMAAEWPGARLMGPTENTLRSEDERAARYVGILDRRYARAGQEPQPAGMQEVATLAAFSADAGLRQAGHDFAGSGCFLSFARVGDSDFVAVVERPYPWPVALLLRQPLGSVAVLGIVVVGVLAGRRWYDRRARHAVA
jgi:serine/threonine protein kinase